jgi:IclR family transcriptional regulator, KDG regulon repressor
VSQDVEGTQPGRSDLGGPSRDRAVKSVDRILGILAHEQSAVGVTHVAERLGLNPSSAHHLLETLKVRGFVGQHPCSRLYQLGVRCLQLGRAYLAGLGLYAVALLYLKRLARECGETVTLAVLDGLGIVPVASIPGSHTFRSLGVPTTRRNAQATALGKVLLATLSADELDGFVAGAASPASLPTPSPHPASSRPSSSASASRATRSTLRSLGLASAASGPECSTTATTRWQLSRSPCSAFWFGPMPQ